MMDAKIQEFKSYHSLLALLNFSLDFRLNFFLVAVLFAFDFVVFVYITILAHSVGV